MWALFAIYIDPVESNGLFGVVYTTLVLYTVYSSIICLFNFFSGKTLPLHLLHWFDIIWYLVLISFSNGTSSIFYFFFFFPILTASFRYGFSEGLRVTVISMLSFTILGFLTVPADEIFELNRFVLRPGYLLILGFLMAYWGGQEILSKRRLALLKNVNRLANPRFGIAQTITSVLEQLQAFYDAEVCLLVVKGLNSSRYSLIKIARDAEQNAPLTPVSKEDISPLLAIPQRIAVFFNSEQEIWKQMIGKKKHYALDIKKNHSTEKYLEITEGIANFLEVKSLASLPLFLKEKQIGRLFIGTERHNFTQSDLEFILQISEQVIPMIENIRLLDDLASKSAERERVKISRDLHDSTVQPYLGLKFKLESILRKVSPEEHIYDEVNELVGMVSKSVTDLRGYISTLKEESVEREPMLINAVKRQAAQFMKYHSLKVDIDAPENLQIPDRLAAEVFQMVSEGLSNINRHTRSDYAFIKISIEHGSLILIIENNNSGVNAPAQPFYPKSLAGRAKALGGKLTITQNGKTSVVIKVPI
jgi:signal transduction histidine kinase